VRDRKKVAEYNRRYRVLHSERHNEYNRRYRLRHPGKRTERRRQRDYGLTKGDVEAILASQQHRCAICGNGFKDSKDCNLDHDHVTSKVRGFLCRRCNGALGGFHDNPVLLENAADYLRKASGL
jgi:hypothetical protein